MAEEAVLSLRPCPFCGSSDVRISIGDYFVVCSNCDTYGPDVRAVDLPDEGPSKVQDAQLRLQAAELWNKRAPMEPAPRIPCEFPSCPNEAAYEGWYRRRDPFLGTPTGHIVRIAFCEVCKSHPHLCANESKPEKAGITDETPGPKGYARVAVPRTQDVGHLVKFPPVEGEGMAVTHFQVVEPPEEETE